MNARRLWATSGLGVVLMFASTSALAQNLGASPEEQVDNSGKGINDIVVTAQRRDESSQKVGISLTVLSADVANSFRTSDQIAQAIPNVQLSSTAGFGAPRTSIRGIAQADFNPNATTSNMVYLDDVALDSPIAQGVPIWDLGRVEVLRGPQGTLFGRNATGGAIRYISAKPTADAEGYADLTLGVNGQRDVRAAYNVPVSETLRARVSFASQHYGGDIYNCPPSAPMAQI